MNKFTKALVQLLVVLASALPVCAQDVLESVPGDATMCVRIHNIDYTLGSIDQFANGLASSPMTASVACRMQLANMLGDPNFQNVDLRGDAAFFLVVSQLDNAEPNIFGAGLLPVTDYAKFISSNTTASKPDANGISVIGPRGMLVVKTGDYAMITSPKHYSQLAKYASAGAQNNLTSKLNGSFDANQSVWGYVDVGQISKTYGAKFNQQIDEKFKCPMEANMPGMEAVRTILPIYAKLIKAAFSQTQNFMFTFNPKPDVLNISTKITAVPDSNLAKILVSNGQVNGYKKLLGYSMPESAFTVAGTFNKETIYLLYDNLFKVLADANTGITTQDRDKIMATVRASLDAVGDSWAMSMTSSPEKTPPFTHNYVIGVTNADELKKQIQAKNDILQTPFFKNFLANIGMSVNQEYRPAMEKYNGVNIDDIAVTFTATDPNSQIAKMNSKLYGNRLVQKMAIVNGLALISGGADANSQIRSLIDKANSGNGQIDPEVAKALAMLPDANQAQVVGTMNYVRYMQMAAAIAPMMPFPTDAFNKMQTKSNIAFAGSVGQGWANLSLAVPKQHIIEIKNLFESAMRQQQKKINENRGKNNRNGRDFNAPPTAEPNSVQAKK